MGLDSKPYLGTKEYVLKVDILDKRRQNLSKRPKHVKRTSMFTVLEIIIGELISRSMVDGIEKMHEKSRVMHPSFFNHE